MTSGDPSPDRIFEVGYAFASSKVLLTAVELGVFTELAQGDGPLGDLAERVGVHPRGAPDFFDALVVLGFLEREDGVYRNTPETDRYLDEAKPTYVGGVLAQLNNAHFPAWQKFTAGLTTGEMQLERQNTEDTLFDFYEDHDQLMTFLEGQNGWNRHSSRALAAAFPFAEYETITDIGCVSGGLLREVLSAHPHLRGIGFDLPESGPHFEAYMDAHDLTDRAKFVGGDFFADEPLPSADVLTLGRILHDWSPEIRRQLLVKVYDALPAGGAAVVIDAIIDDERRETLGPMLLSMSMLLATPRGGEYTAADCIGWMNDAGFKETRVEHLSGLDTMIVAIK